MTEQTWPQLDDRVHVWIDGQGCHPGTVEQRILDAPTGGNVVALSIKTDRRVADCSHRISRDYDPGMEVSGSWHWPHDDGSDSATSIRATHCVTFQPDEIRAIRMAARTAGTTVTTWLHDLAVANTSTRTAPRVEINFDHTGWTDEQAAEFVREFTDRFRRQAHRQF